MRRVRFLVSCFSIACGRGEQPTRTITPPVDAAPVAAIPRDAAPAFVPLAAPAVRDPVLIDDALRDRLRQCKRRWVDGEWGELYGPNLQVDIDQISPVAARTLDKMVAVDGADGRFVVAFHQRHCDVFGAAQAPVDRTEGVFVPGRPAVRAEVKLADWCAADAAQSGDAWAEVCDAAVWISSETDPLIDLVRIPRLCGPTIQIAALPTHDDHDSLLVTCDGASDGEKSYAVVLSWLDGGLAGVLDADLGYRWEEWPAQSEGNLIVENPSPDPHCLGFPVGQVTVKTRAQRPVLYVVEPLTADEGESGDYAWGGGCFQHAWRSEWTLDPAKRRFVRTSRRRIVSRDDLCTCD